MKRASILGICVIIAALGLVMLSACAGQQNRPSVQSVSSSSGVTMSASTSASSSSSLPIAALQIGAGDITVQTGNATGYEIVGIRIKPASDEGYSSENSFDGFSFADGATAELSFASVPNVQNYDVLLLTSVDSKIAVRNIDLASLKNLTFHFEEGIGYITYTDATTGESRDNREEAFANEGGSSSTYDIENQNG